MLLNRARQLQPQTKSEGWIKELQKAFVSLMISVRRSALTFLRTLLLIRGVVLLVMGLMLIGVAGLSGCASFTPQIPIPDRLKTRCERPDLPPPNPTASPVERQTEVSVFSVKQEQAMNVCDDKRQALANIAESWNKKVRQENCAWWKFGLCK